MGEVSLPRAWESLLASMSFLPVIVKSIENYFNSDWSMNPNRHDHFEMVYVKKGDGIFEVAGQPVPIGPNDILIIKPNQVHKLIVKSKTGCQFIVLSFRFAGKLSKEYSEISLEDFLNFVRENESGAFIVLKVNQKNEIIDLLNRIIKEKENDDIGSEFLRYLLILELFVLLSRALKMEWENSIKGKSLKLKELIRIAVEFIYNNFEREISVKDMANYVFLSTGYFTRAFKEETGITPVSYLRKVRIERAKDLLAETDMKVAEIAQSVGFSNQQRFNETFRQQVKMTPLEYRKRNRTPKNGSRG
ncbi:MAG TPA: AraC family transcriptional regulator [Clostridiaceae bacterium]|jgi:AraC-like DNA-binding protein|nr:AraC family transcriptional regulator [Clostridiaceae bacterium]